MLHHHSLHFSPEDLISKYKTLGMYGYDLIVDDFRSLRVVIIWFWVVLDRFGSLWAVVARFAWFLIDYINQLCNLRGGPR